jgi:serine phosphatase RsbU (regulator of sigma subunit)
MRVPARPLTKPSHPEINCDQKADVVFESEDRERMQCMEVWGGNVVVERQFQTSGLDVWISSQPEGQSQAGGDVYYVSSCASGRITRLLLADVSGHGERVADLAARLRDLMRQNVNTIGHRRFVAAMNRHFSDAADGGRFATAVVSSYFAPTCSLSLCNAGHPPPLIFRIADRRWSTLENSPQSSRDMTEQVSDLPLGVIADTPYREHTLRLDKGDMVLCYTDAFSEARDADGKTLGVEGLLSIVSAARVSSAGRLLADLTESLRLLNSANLHDDDATLLLYRANSVRPSIRDNLAAPFRLLGRVADESRISPPSPAVSDA